MELYCQAANRLPWDSLVPLDRTTAATCGLRYESFNPKNQHGEHVLE